MIEFAICFGVYRDDAFKAAWIASPQRRVNLTRYPSIGWVVEFIAD